MRRFEAANTVGILSGEKAEEFCCVCGVSRWNAELRFMHHPDQHVIDKHDGETHFPICRTCYDGKLWERDFPGMHQCGCGG